MICTVITVFAAEVDLNKYFSGLNIIVALTIAVFKASLVVLFFMHGKYSPKRTQLVIIASVAVGYIALAAFVVDQIVWIACVGSVLYLVLALIEEVIAASFKPTAAPAPPAIRLTIPSCAGLLQGGIDALSTESRTRLSSLSTSPSKSASVPIINR